MAVKRTKTTTTTIRLTPQELSYIQKKADEAGITRNQYIVNMAVSNGMQMAGSKVGDTAMHQKHLKNL